MVGGVSEGKALLEAPGQWEIPGAEAGSRWKKGGRGTPTTSVLTCPGAGGEHQSHSSYLIWRNGGYREQLPRVPRSIRNSGSDEQVPCSCTCSLLTLPCPVPWPQGSPIGKDQVLEGGTHPSLLYLAESGTPYSHSLQLSARVGQASVTSSHVCVKWGQQQQQQQTGSYLYHLQGKSGMRQQKAGESWPLLLLFLL